MQLLWQKIRKQNCILAEIFFNVVLSEMKEVIIETRNKEK